MKADGVGIPGSRLPVLTFGFTVCRCQAFVFAMAGSIVGAKILQKMWGEPYWEGVLPCLDPWDVVRLRTSSSCPGEHGPHSELFFFLIRKEAGGSHEGSAVQSFCLCGNAQGVCADWLKPLVAEGETGSSSSQSPDFGYGLPKKLGWDSDGESGSESEGLFSSYFREHNVESHALNVIGQNWSVEKVSLFPGGLGTCEGGLELPRCPGYVVPGNA